MDWRATRAKWKGLVDGTVLGGFVLRGPRGPFPTGRPTGSVFGWQTLFFSPVDSSVVGSPRNLPCITFLLACAIAPKTWDLGRHTDELDVLRSPAEELREAGPGRRPSERLRLSLSLEPGNRRGVDLSARSHRMHHRHPKQLDDGRRGRGRGSRQQDKPFICSRGTGDGAGKRTVMVEDLRGHSDATRAVELVRARRRARFERCPLPYMSVLLGNRR